MLERNLLVIGYSRFSFAEPVVLFYVFSLISFHHPSRFDRKLFGTQLFNARYSVAVFFLHILHKSIFFYMKIFLPPSSLLKSSISRNNIRNLIIFINSLVAAI